MEQKLIVDGALFRAGKTRFPGTQQSVLLKASSGEHCAPRNFVLLLTLRCTRVPLIETNLGTAVSTRMILLDVPMVSSLLHLERVHTFSKYFIVEFRDLFLAAFTSRDQNTDKYKLQNMQAQVQIMSY